MYLLSEAIHPCSYFVYFSIRASILYFGNAAVLWPAYRLSLRSGWRHTLVALLVEAGNFTNAAPMRSCEHNGHRPTCAEQLCVGVGMSKFIHHGMIYVVRGIWLVISSIFTYYLTSDSAQRNPTVHATSIFLEADVPDAVFRPL